MRRKANRTRNGNAMGKYCTSTSRSGSSVAHLYCILISSSLESRGYDERMKKGAGKSAIAFLWDESFLWGIMAYKALREAGLPFRLIRAADIGTGALLDCSALVVPGGWASNKIKVLGEPGISGIRQFVKEGGMYVGFCGGAGLATSDGIGLL